VQLHPAWRLSALSGAPGRPAGASPVAHAVRGKRGTVITTDLPILIEAIAALIAAFAQLIGALRGPP
jgi:hypothetical protein